MQQRGASQAESASSYSQDLNCCAPTAPMPGISHGTSRPGTWSWPTPLLCPLSPGTWLSNASMIGPAAKISLVKLPPGKSDMWPGSYDPNIPGAEEAGVIARMQAGLTRLEKERESKQLMIKAT
eukprot:4909554-Amphidinium_carterae.1